MDARFCLWSVPKATEKTQKNTTSGTRKGDFWGVRVRKADGQSAPLLGAKTKKKRTESFSPLDKWWSWGDLNPRPQAFFGQIYMLSGLI
jgi:hypothetical protein